MDEELVDILGKHRGRSDLGWAMAKKDFPQFHGCQTRTSEELLRTVLESERVKTAVSEEAERRGWPRDAMEAEARTIGEEMGHNFKLGTLRCVGYVIHKAFQRIFRHVYSNPAEIQRIREVTKERPVVFLPTHKTYMDFLLLSYICFEFQLRPPTIASAMDFMGMKFVGEALRRCGAFFMRRSFGGDKLYWAIFTEYVQEQLRNGDQPLEFFVEGTRSRTGKNLHPKLGLLAATLEPFLKRELFDVLLVPVSISYSRVLEESLYAYELLGFSKPKESTSGLWKARSILETDFGDVYIHFSSPFSVRDYFTADSLQKSSLESVSLGPKSSFTISSDQKSQIRALAHSVVKIHQQNAVVSMWSLICIAINQVLARKDSNEIDLCLLVERAELLHRLATGFGYKIRLHTKSVEDEIAFNSKLHSNVMEVIGTPEKKVRLKSVAVSAMETAGRLPPALIDSAVPRILVSNYANKGLHVYAEPAILAAVRGDAPDRSPWRLCDVRQAFKEVQALLWREFIFVPGHEERCLVDAHERLCKANLLQRNGEFYQVIKPSDLIALAGVIRPFLLGYWVAAETLATHPPLSLAKLLHRCQNKGHEALLLRPSTAHDCPTLFYQILSTDLLKNAIHSLLDLKIVEKKKLGSEEEFHVKSPEKLAQTGKMLVDFLGGEKFLGVASRSSFKPKL